jgi:hypothetical protein
MKIEEVMVEISTLNEIIRDLRFKRRGLDLVSLPLFTTVCGTAR